jgi:hypothetical protein
MFESLHQGQRLAPVHHAMSQGRLIFLVVLVVFFCTLFIGSYIWMRRPNFGQIGGRERRPSEPGAPEA